MSNDLSKRITIRLTPEAYEWYMENGGSDLARKVLEAGKKKLENK